MSKPGDWMLNPQFLADMGHTFGACSLIMTSWVLLGWLPTMFVQTGVVVAAILKEFVYDLKYETGETLRTSAEDFAGYMLGSLLAWGIYVVHVRWIH